MVNVMGMTEREKFLLGSNKILSSNLKLISDFLKKEPEFFGEEVSNFRHGFTTHGVWKWASDSNILEVMVYTIHSSNEIGIEYSWNCANRGLISWELNRERLIKFIGEFKQAESESQK